MLRTTLIVITLLFPAALAAANNGTRAACFFPEVGLQCSSDCTQLGYCDEHFNWISLTPCPAGQICVGSTCVVSNTCPTTPSTTSVICSDSSLKMPNLEDTTCTTYYTCAKSIGSAIGYGVLQLCPAGTIFDACTGQCVIGSCPAIPSCQSHLQILPTNQRLAYVCAPTYMVWATCPKGIYLPLVTGAECYEGISYSCPNGAGNSGSTCTAAGRYTIVGTDCGYLQCYSDLSFSVFPCRTGYRYDDIVKECVAGTCTGTLPTPAKVAVNE